MFRDGVDVFFCVFYQLSKYFPFIIAYLFFDCFLHTINLLCFLLKTDPVSLVVFQIIFCSIVVFPSLDYELTAFFSLKKHNDLTDFRKQSIKKGSLLSGGNGTTRRYESNNYHLINYASIPIYDIFHLWTIYNIKELAKRFYSQHIATFLLKTGATFSNIYLRPQYIMFQWELVGYYKKNTVLTTDVEEHF